MTRVNGARTEMHPLKSEVRTTILAYIRTHPHAADAVEGIAAWWLGNIGESVSRQVLEAVLEELVLSHELRRIATGGGGVLYAPLGSEDEPLGKDR